MSKRRLTMLIALCTVITVSGSYTAEAPDKFLVAAPVEEPQARWSDLADEYRDILLHTIRVEHLTRKTGITEEMASRIVAAVDLECLNYDCDPNLIIGLIIVESWGNPNAESRVGALGLMQVMPATGKYIARTSGFKWSGVEGLRAVESNISYGTWYLDYLLHKFGGDEHAAISAYNWGPENIRSRIKNAKKLPQVYPGKVYAARDELQGVIWNEYQSRFWRGADQYVSDSRRQQHAARPERRSSDCELHVRDGQGICMRDGESVPASPGDLSQ
jgi:hypothetical protein